MPLIKLSNLNAPQLEPFRELKDKSLRSQGRFVVEGRLLATRLLASSLKTHAILITEQSETEWTHLDQSDIPVYSLPREEISKLIGFEFHRGVLACGVRPEHRPLEDLLNSDAQSAKMATDHTHTLLILPDINVVENLGALMRTAAAFGVNGLILGPTACDPWYRRCIRVSMGNVFDLPIHISQDLHKDLDALHHRYQYTRIGAVLSANAIHINQYQRPKKIALLMGNEATGLTPPYLNQLDTELTIPMANDVDSLNIAAAGAVMLYALTQNARQ